MDIGYEEALKLLIKQYSLVYVGIIYTFPVNLIY